MQMSCGLIKHTFYKIIKVTPNQIPTGNEKVLHLQRFIKEYENYEIIDKLYAYHNADRAEFTALINTVTDEELEYLRKKAQQTAQKYYGNKVYIRGLIEISSICKMTAFTAVYAGRTQTQCDTALARSRFCSAVIQAMRSAFAPLFCRAERTDILLMMLCAILCKNQAKISRLRSNAFSRRTQLRKLQKTV